jgi:hypothetical protein
VWTRRLFWFTSGVHIANDPRWTVATEDEQHPVVLNGEGEIRISREEIAHVLELVNAKYETDYRMDMMDPARTRRSAYDRWWAFGLDADDFTGSPTRWTFQ